MIDRTAGTTALMLPGGGARGAYQVGVVKAVHEIAGGTGNPFPIIVGTSAGAINAAVLASHAHEFDFGVGQLERFWREMRPQRVYRTDWRSALGSGLHWVASLLFGRLGVPSPKSLLDSSPLRALLQTEGRFDGIAEAIDSGALEAIAITASGYTSANAITFYQARDAQPWQRARRLGRADRITVDHLLGSAALPLLFPAVRVGNQYFGDGGIRQTAPLSPAIHLGAQRILVVTTRDEHPDPEPARLTDQPSFGDITGYLLDVLFMDNIEADIARVRRINRTLSLLDPDNRARSELRLLDVLVIRPSRDLRDITQRHLRRVPSSVRLLLAGVGAWRRDTRLPSYLLFDGEFCSELIALGYRDAMSMRAEVRAFLDGRDPLQQTRREGEAGGGGG